MAMTPGPRHKVACEPAGVGADDEAHVSTEADPAVAGTRLLEADGQQKWPTRPAEPSEEGSLEVDRFGRR